MALYCGIDLHSSNCQIVVLDGKLETVMERRQRNELGEIVQLLEPHREELAGIAVESTRNWYWLVDGLMEAGHHCHLANTAAIQQYEGLKYADDRHDARWLARLLALGILPEGYIYPRQERPWRDLLRRRAFLVRSRTAQLLTINALLEQYTGRSFTVNVMKRWTGPDIQQEVGDSPVALGAIAMLRVVKVLTAQIRHLEKEVVGHIKLRDEFQLLRTARGIGEAIALTIMCEVGDIRRFRKVGNFASYCRCVKSEHLSNGKRKGSGNKRNGNPYLSWAFSEAAHFAVRFEPRAKRFFDKKSRATNKIVANRALANKMARACYYVLRDQVPFEPQKVFG
jgi:transposase